MEEAITIATRFKNRVCANAALNGTRLCSSLNGANEKRAPVTIPVCACPTVHRATLVRRRPRRRCCCCCCCCCCCSQHAAFFCSQHAAFFCMLLRAATARHDESARARRTALSHVQTRAAPLPTLISWGARCDRTRVSLFASAFDSASTHASKHHHSISTGYHVISSGSLGNLTDSEVQAQFARPLANSRNPTIKVCTNRKTIPEASRRSQPKI